MLVTFTTTTYSDITMFGSAAVALLKLMGQSGKVPGAIMADEVPQALSSLREGLEKLTEEQKSSTDAGEPATRADSTGFDEDEQETVIGLDKRAGPLISLLEAAIEAKDNVLWSD